MINCVILDLDGLMVNSEVIARQVYKDEALKFGYDLDDEFFVGITGSSLKTSRPHFDRFEGLINHVPYIAKKRKEAILKASETPGFLNKKGLIPLLDYLFENNYKVCVASSSFLDYVETLLNSLGKKYEFDVICTGDMVNKHKPNPDIFLLAADKAKVKPENCLVLEDSKNGIIAAKAANMKAAFIYDTIEADDIVKKLLDYNLNDLEEVIEVLKKAE